MPAMAVIIMVAMVGCGKMPHAEIDAAKAAVESVKGLQADIYLPAEFGQLQDSLNVAIAGIEAQQSKMFKSFGDEKVKLEAVVSAADEVSRKTAIRKDEVKAEAESLLATLTATITENKELIAKAPKGKDGAAVLEVIKTEMTVIETSVAEATTLHIGGEYMTALDKFKAANDKATRINTELKEAIAKVRR